MSDPLVWRSGDGPMEDWLERVTGLLAGSQPDGYRVWGDVQWPDQVYGRITRTGLGPADLTEVFAEEGFDSLSVTTHGGTALNAPTMRIMPLVERHLGPNGDAVRVYYAEPSGTPVGRVRIAAPVRTPADLDEWLQQLSPLLPEGVPELGWSTDALPVPLAATFLHQEDETLLCLDTLESRERPFGTPSSVLRVSVQPADLARCAALIRVPEVLTEPSLPNVRELARWLGELGDLWHGRPFPKTGTRAAASPLPRGTRARVHEIEHGAPVLGFSRTGRPELFVQGPAVEITEWGSALLEPAVHEEAPSGHRKLVRWLRKVEQAVFHGPADWAVPDTPWALSSPELARWLRVNCPDRRIAVDRIVDGVIRLDGTRTPMGWATVTGRGAAR